MLSMIKRQPIFLAFFLLVTLLSACSSVPKQFAIRGEGDQMLNRDSAGKSLSVEVHIYQLKDAREFSKLTFDILASGRPENELFGPALLDKTDLILVPGGNYTSSEKLLEATKFVGVVAFFRNPDAHFWRQLVEVEAMEKQGSSFGGKTGLSFRLQDCYITLNGVKPVLLPDQQPNTRPECGNPNRTRQGNRPTAQGNPQSGQQQQNSAQNLPGSQR